MLGVVFSSRGWHTMTGGLVQVCVGIYGGVWVWQVRSGSSSMFGGLYWIPVLYSGGVGGHASGKKKNACTLGSEASTRLLIQAPNLQVLAQTFNIVICLFCCVTFLHKCTFMWKVVASQFKFVLPPPSEFFFSIPRHLASRAYLKGWTLEGGDVTFNWM